MVVDQLGHCLMYPKVLRFVVTFGLVRVFKINYKKS
jgi:hypothetical protein